MPVGTCDPASRGDQWNVGEVAYYEGKVSVRYQFGWDGVSVRPDCVGPLGGAQAINRDPTKTYYAWFIGPRGNARKVVIQPATQNANGTITNRVQNYTTNQLNNAGFIDNTDMESIYISDQDVNPFQAQAARIK